MHTTLKLLLCAVALVALGACSPQDKDQPQGLAGWESGSAYDKRFSVVDFDKIKGNYKETVEITPMPGMAPGLALVVVDRTDFQPVTVHLGPKSYVEPELEQLGLKKGQKVKAYGAWAEFEGGDVLMATKIKITEDRYLKVRRTKDGFPYWSMTPEERQAEQSD